MLVQQVSSGLETYDTTRYLLQERDQCREVVKLLRAKIEEVKTAAQAKHDEYWQAELAWREQRAAEKQRRDAEYQAQRAEREAAHRARMAELAGEPFHQEVGYGRKSCTYELLRWMPAIGTGPACEPDDYRTGITASQQIEQHLHWREFHNALLQN